MIQNADDAGATEVRFFLDNRTHSSDALLQSNLSAYQGPSLLAFNNAVFADRDWASIQKVCLSELFVSFTSTAYELRES